VQSTLSDLDSLIIASCFIINSMDIGFGCHKDIMGNNKVIN